LVCCHTAAHCECLVSETGQCLVDKVALMQAFCWVFWFSSIHYNSSNAPYTCHIYRNMFTIWKWGDFIIAHIVCRYFPANWTLWSRLVFIIRYEYLRSAINPTDSMLSQPVLGKDFVTWYLDSGLRLC
jgi:hypothetical protein